MPGQIDASRKVVIEEVTPQLDCGRYAIKREVGDTIEVRADIFKEGHDAISAAIWYRPEDEDEWREAPMKFWDNDRWTGSFTPDRNCRWYYTVVAWTDFFGTWQSDLRKKYDAGQEVVLELFEGAEIVARTAAAAPKGERDKILQHLDEMIGDVLDPTAAPEKWKWAAFEKGAAAAEDRTIAERVAAALDAGFLEVMERTPLRDDLTQFEPILPVQVDRVPARFAAWYEIFPRSMADDPTRHGTWDDVVAKLPYVRDMGFDVLYFPPIHPIGLAFRKGKNNTLGAGPDQPGSPYAIGGKDGGHRDVHPELGSRTSGAWWPPRRSTGWRSRSTSPSRSPPTTRTPARTLAGSLCARTGRSNTRRTRPRSTRTSTRSTSTARTGKRSGRSGATSFCTGWSRG
jgi:starch synthase (maltosyl-transferring)